MNEGEDILRELEQERKRRPHCPVCGAEVLFVYRTVGDEIVGCEKCVREWFAYEVDECFRED